MRAALLIRAAVGVVLGLLVTVGEGAAKQAVVRVQVLNKVRKCRLLYLLVGWEG